MTLKNTGIFLLKILVTSAIIWWILRSFGLNKIIDTVRHTDIRWLIAALCVSIASIVAGAWQWDIILKNRRIIMPFRETLRVYIIGMFMNNFVFGMVTGDVYRIASIRFSGKEGKKGLAATFMDRLAGLISLSVFAIVGGVYILRKNIDMNKELYAAFAALALFTSIFIFILILIASTRLQSISRNIIQSLAWIPGSAKISLMMEQTFMDLHTPHDRIMFLTVAMISTLVQGMRICVHILCAVALGIFSLSQIYYFFIIIPVTALMMVIPLPLGVKEAATGSLFNAAGFVYHEALVMEFLATIVGIFSALPGGIVFLQSSKRK